MQTLREVNEGGYLLKLSSKFFMFLGLSSSIPWKFTLVLEDTHICSISLTLPYIYMISKWRENMKIDTIQMGMGMEAVMVEAMPPTTHVIYGHFSHNFLDVETIHIHLSTSSCPWWDTCTSHLHWIFFFVLWMLCM